MMRVDHKIKSKVTFKELKETDIYISCANEGNTISYVDSKWKNIPLSDIKEDALVYGYCFRYIPKNWNIEKQRYMNFDKEVIFKLA